MIPRDAARRRTAVWRVGLFAAVGYAYLGMLVGLFGVAAYLLARNGYGALALASGATVLFLISTLRVQLPAPTGSMVTPSEAPGLFRLLEEARRALDAPSVHHVVLTPEVNASVVDLPRYGVFGSRRHLALGVPLLTALTVDELRAVLAHELAHLAHHGRLRLWAGRVQATWTALAMSAQWQRSWAAILYVPFFRWYAPRLAALVESASRGDELEADRLATGHVGPRTVARALLRIAVAGAYWQEESLPLLFQESASHANPLADDFLRALRRAPRNGWPDLTGWIESLLSERSLDSDSHPCLSDRLSALGVRCSDARQLADELRAAGDGGATSLLEPSRDGLLGAVARAWAAEARLDWRRLHADADVWRSTPPDADVSATRWARWARARWAAFCEPPDVAIPRLRGVIEDELFRREARFLLGRLLVQRPAAQARAEGRRLLELVIEEDSSFALEAVELLQRAYAREGREDEIRRCKVRASALQATYLRAIRERATLELGDTLRPHPLPAVALTRLRSELERHEKIRRAFLVQKQTRNLRASPIVVLALEVSVPWYRPDWDTHGDMIAALVERVALPQSMDLLLLPLPGRGRLARRLGRLAGAEVYAPEAENRLLPARDVRPWSRGPLLARVAWRPLMVGGASAIALAGAASLYLWGDTGVSEGGAPPMRSLVDLREAVRRDPSDPVATLELARALVRTDSLESALPVARRAVELTVDDSDAHLVLGEILYLSGRRAEALPVLTESIRLNPQSVDSHYYLGTTLTALGRPVDAERSFRRALELDSLDAYSYSALAMVLNTLGRTDEGEQAARASVRLDSLHGYGWVALGTVQKNLGRTMDAIGSFRRVAELSPRDPRAWLEIGVLEHIVGNYDGSVEALERARDLNPVLFDRLDFEPAVLAASRQRRPYGQ